MNILFEQDMLTLDPQNKQSVNQQNRQSNDNQHANLQNPEILTGRITVITTLKTGKITVITTLKIPTDRIIAITTLEILTDKITVVAIPNFNRQNYGNNNHQNYPNTTQQNHNYQNRYDSLRQLNPAQKEFSQQHPRYPSPEPRTQYELVGNL
ncbi:unnamed protein product, partial [Ceratitis capitata]